MHIFTPSLVSSLHVVRRTEAVLVQRLQRNLNSVAAKVNSFEQMCSSEVGVGGESWGPAL